MTSTRMSLTDGPVADVVRAGTARTFLWADSKEDGRGSTGQVKKATWGSRSIEILNQDLNRGSLIDFLNAIIQTQSTLKPLDKGGWIFGGATDETILTTFETITKMSNLRTILKALKHPPQNSNQSENFYAIDAQQPGYG